MIVQIGRFESCFEVTSINYFSAALREGHLKPLVKIFGYLKNATGRRESIVILSENIREISGKVDNTDDWLEKYPNTS